MTQLLVEDHQHTLLSPQDLLSLEEAGIAGGAFAMRELDPGHLGNLFLSDSARWPDIKVTLCSSGYILIDGYHRWAVAKRKRLKGLYATCKTYSSEQDVVEAAFRANLRHGLKASVETRGDYAYWLHLVYPTMEQKDIAARVGITQGAVSKAIAKREEEARTTQQEDPDQQRKLLKRSCKKFARMTIQFLGEVENLDDRELVAIFHMVVKRNEDKEKLARIGRLLSLEHSVVTPR